MAKTRAAVPTFGASLFTATQFDTAQDKADFANWLVRFIVDGFKCAAFHTARYRRLSNCFGMIAHYNKFGFYDAQFETPQRRQEFLQHITHAWRCPGDPAWTFSDVEKCVQQWLKDRTSSFEEWATKNPEGLPAHHRG
jgi:hypothetical protein